MSSFIRSLVVGSMLALGACASPSAELAHTVPPDMGAVVGIDAWPSPAAAALLPEGVGYRFAVASPGEIALLVMSRDGRIAGRVRILADDQWCEVVVDDFAGAQVQVDARTTGDRVEGRVIVGRREATWRVRMDADGSLAGERWSARTGSGDAAEHVNLLRARALTHDINRIAIEREDLLPEGALELAVLAELSVELSVRAWERRGRAHLPSLASLVGP